MTRFARTLLLTATMLLPAAAARALESARGQRIYLEGDSVQMDEKKGISTCRGNVKVTQGSRELSADVVHVEQGEKGDVVVAEGTPATFSQRHENRDQPVTGTARRIEHRSAENLLILTGDAEFTQGGDRFSSSRIEYDTRGDVVRAGQASAAAGPGDRVRIVIQPRGQGSTAAPPAPRPDTPR